MSSAAAPPPPGYAALVSADGRSFLVSLRHARLSRPLAAMLDGAFLEARTRTVALPVRGAVLEKVCQYLYHAARSAAAAAAGEPAAEDFEIPGDLMKEVYDAALYLDL